MHYLFKRLFNIDYGIRYIFTLLVCIIYTIITLDAQEHIKIGNQKWLLRSLDATQFENGDYIAEAHNRSDWIKYGNSKTPAFCSYDFNSANDKIYGKLYNIYALTDNKGIMIPSGYYIPMPEHAESAFHNIIKGNYSIDSHKSKSLCNNCRNWSDKYRKLMKCSSCLDKRYITTISKYSKQFNMFDFGCIVNQNGDFYNLDFTEYFRFYATLGTFKIGYPWLEEYSKELNQELPFNHISLKNIYSIGYNIRLIRPYGY